MNAFCWQEIKMQEMELHKPIFKLQNLFKRIKMGLKLPGYVGFHVKGQLDAI